MLIVDRIEENYVVLEREDQSMQDVEIEKFPSEIKAGDVVIFEDGKYLIDQEATEKRTEQIKTLMDSLWED